MRRALLTIAVTLLASAASAPAEAAAPPGQWLAGDLHVHTCYSHDVWCGPDDDNTDIEDFYTFGHTVAEDFQLASLRGLDYLAITDHNDIRSQSDPGFGADGVIPIHGYENSLNGHGQMLGARKIYDSGDHSAAAVTKMAAQLRKDGGIFQANHPNDPLWQYQYSVPVDTVEVWNLPRFYQPPLPSASDNDKAIAYWEGWLDRGVHVTATGGSDSHWKLTDAVQGIGNPTTWVYAKTKDERGILDGIRAGRTFITWAPPAFQPPRLYLEGGKDTMVGGTIKAGDPVRVRVDGAPGATLRLVGTGGKPVGDPVTVTGSSFEQDFTVPKGVTWVFAELYGDERQEARQQACDPVLGSGTTYCHNRIAALAMTSALWIKQPRR